MLTRNTQRPKFSENPGRQLEYQANLASGFHSPEGQETKLQATRDMPTTQS